MRINTTCVHNVFMRDVTNLFDEIGGPRKMAALLDVKPSAASEMKRRGSIPVKYWPKLVDGFKNLHLTNVDYDTLVSMHSERAA